MKDIIVVGGGIVGLATAYQCLKKAPHLKVTLLEKESEVATHQTGHNSGVIHSGIYYKPGSAKATNCRRGYSLLLKFAQENNIPHEICGKLIVATRASELSNLHVLYKRGIENGLKGLKLLSSDESKKYEPHVNALQSILVPEAGIIDYKEVSQALYNKIVEMGGEVIFESEVLNIKSNGSDLSLYTANGITYQTKKAVNCCGLFCDEIAELQINPKMRIIPFRGEYYSLKQESEYLVKHLIYPVPNPAFPFLGVHFTRMIGGGVEAGPNAVLAMAKEGYSWKDFSLKDMLRTLSWKGFYRLALKYPHIGAFEVFRSFSKSLFVHSLQKLIPEIQGKDIYPYGSGVRAQALDTQGNTLDDFKFVESGNMVHVLNCPSPAATSSLSIGLTICDLLIKPTLKNEPREETVN